METDNEMKHNVKQKTEKPSLMIFMIGAIAGASYLLNTTSSLRSHRLSESMPMLEFGDMFLALLFASMFAIFLHCLRMLACKLVFRSSLQQKAKDSYAQYDWISYLPCLVYVLGAFGVRFPMPITLFLLSISIVLIQVGLIYYAMDFKTRERAFTSIQWLVFLFLISGFAALIYQIVWQRVLFAAFGVNIESVTVTVSLFMFGLGVGSLVGGQLSRRFPLHLPRLFLACELGIGLFGLISIPLIKTVGDMTLHGSLFTISMTTYALLSLPTIFMGATLPILVDYLHRYYRNIGKSVGVLYFINTLGSAIACFITVDILFAFFGQQTAVIVAAMCNFSVALLVFRYAQRLDRSEIKVQAEKDIAIQSETSSSKRGYRARVTLMMLLSAATGYISLSQEILWFRVISYSTGGKPDVFGYLLGFILLGIACGALVAKRVCEERADMALPFVAILLMSSSLLYSLSIPLIAWVMTLAPEIGLIISYLSAAIIALLIGSIFPIVSHYAIHTDTQAGFPLSMVYFANILGATTGPILMGFILLDLYSFEVNVLILSSVTLFLGGVVGFAYRPNLSWKLGVGICLVIAMTMIAFIHNGLYTNIFEKLLYKTMSHVPFKHVIQNRSGIIAVSPPEPDIVFGGGVYDGRFNVDPINNANGIRRAYMIAALHPKPSNVLEIGLSTGSWARVVADHELISNLKSVEINPGYIDPAVSSLLQDAKVSIVMDDGRRWLNRHPDEKFDFILMNTTFHWRDHATNLLSADFLRICKGHLNLGGVIYFNATGSEDALFTAAAVFKHVIRFDNFVAASDSPFIMTQQQKRENLLRFYRSETPVLNPQVPELQSILEDLVNYELVDLAPAYREKTDLYYISDDNMATEYKIEKKWFDAKAKWADYLAGLMSGSM
jgi:spermidine synthase